VITPRRTRLVRVADLHDFRSAIVALAARADPEASIRDARARRETADPRPAPAAGNPGPADDATPDAMVVVPTRGAARQLARGGSPLRAATRDELYDELHRRLANPPRRLTALQRDVIAQAAARAAAGRHPKVAFRLRPGLVAEILRFYDQLRRQSQQVKRFEELLADALGDDDLDRAAERMRVQTAFLADAFREYERAAATIGCDEHTLRDRLVAEPAAAPLRHVIVTVADWIVDADGLYVADFDLLTRIPGLERLDIVCTERVLASGFHERLHDWWPGLEESTASGFGLGEPEPVRPLLVTPPKTTSQAANPDEPWWTFRDREEELVAIARWIDGDARHGEAAPLDRSAVVYKHPLPYLYAAAGVLRAAGLRYQSGDALPLAAEPTAAALDLVFDAVASGFTRSTIVALLRSPHFAFAADGAELTRGSASALDRFLSDSRYLGDPDRLAALADGGAPEPRHRSAGAAASAAAAPALAAALAIVRELAPLAESLPASRQVRRLLAFWRSHLRPLADDDPFAARERRARAAVDNLLEALAAVHAAHDDPPWRVDELAIAARRGIEDQTFAADQAGAGLHLLDDRAARYGDFDDVAIVGLIDADWPERPHRNIFYPPSVLKSLGWPSEKDRRAAADARFLDLIGSAARRTTLTTVTLEDEALVTRSLQLDDVPRARLTQVRRDVVEPSRVFVDEALSIDPVDLDRAGGEARGWAELRMARSPADRPEFHGTVGGAPARRWSVSALETYLDCPFRFFAQHVLKLEEEPDDEEVMDPRRQGQFVHRVFERFFRAWHEAGHRAITPATLDAARGLFTTVVDRALEQLPQAEAALERTRLLGSPAAAGLGEAVFRMEAERPVAVVERLLEHALDGEFAFATADGRRTVSLRGKADRIDLLADGTFRLIDYKLGWPPQRTRALQLPIYGLCAEQHLAARHGRRWALGEAAYLAFKGPRRVVPLCTVGDRGRVMAEAQQRLVDTLDAIERGEFPPTPDDVWRCETCSYAPVCRKDYVGDV
jgi:RecB family exonuclease